VPESLGWKFLCLDFHFFLLESDSSTTFGTLCTALESMLLGCNGRGGGGGGGRGEENNVSFLLKFGAEGKYLGLGGDCGTLGGVALVVANPRTLA